MNWYIYAALSVLGTAVSNIYRKIVMKDDKSDAIASTAVFYIIGSVITGLFAYFHGFQALYIEKFWINYLISTVFWGTASVLLFKSLQYIEASEEVIITSFTSIVTIVSAVILLHEKFTVTHLTGTVLIIFSIIFISKFSAKLRFNKGVWYALGYCVFAGLGTTNDAYLLQSLDALSYLSFVFLLQGVFLLLVIPKTVGKLKYFMKFTVFSQVFVLTFFYVLAAIAFFLALQSGAQASQLSPISQSAVVVTIVIAAVFLKERDHLWQKFFCAVLVSIGVVLLGM